MNTQKLTIGGIIVAVVFSLIAVFSGRGTTVVNNPAPIQAGSVAGPDSSFPTENHNGIPLNFSKQAYYLASTSICSFRAVATSSIEFVTLQTGIGTSTALTFRIATSTTGNTATTTALYSGVSAANATDSFFYRGKTGDVLTPGTFVNVSFEGVSGVSANSGLRGSCGIVTVSN